MTKKKIIEHLEALLLLYQQRPETHIKNIEWVKNTDDAKEYLMLSTVATIKHILRAED